MLKPNQDAKMMDLQNGTGIRLELGKIKPETRSGYILVCLALWSVIASLVIQHFVVTSVVVEGRSMMPALKPGDCRFVNCWLPRFRGYRRGDIVVIHDSERHEYIVKRIVGLPHEHVQLRRGQVYINGQRLSEPYLGGNTETYSPQIRDHVIEVGTNSYFVMGDNRLESQDSRYFGDVDRADLIGLVSR